MRTDTPLTDGELKQIAQHGHSPPHGCVVNMAAELLALREACKLALPVLRGTGVDFGPAAVAADAVEAALATRPT